MPKIPVACRQNTGKSSFNSAGKSVLGNFCTKSSSLSLKAQDLTNEEDEVMVLGIPTLIPDHQPVSDHPGWREVLMNSAVPKHWMYTDWEQWN